MSKKFCIILSKTQLYSIVETEVFESENDDFFVKIIITLDFKKNMEYNIERKRGSLCDRLRGRYTFDRLPDLDNANVGIK